jgi:hypothetical protein
MRILVLDYGWCNFHNLLSLAESGHDVSVVTTAYDKFEDIPHNFMKQFGIEILNINRDTLLVEYMKTNTDLLIGTNPQIPHLSDPRHRPDNVDYLGLTRQTKSLEWNKFAVRHSLQKRGVLVPELKDPVVPFVMKPKVVGTPLDYVQIVLDNEGGYVEEFQRPPFKGEVFYEEYIPKPSIETNVAFCMAKGKWSIMHTQEIIGEDVAKMAGRFTHWTKTSSFKPLPEWVNEIVLENAEIILNWCAEVCSQSSYVGQITGLCTPDGDWYFCEVNVRPEQTCSLPYFVTGDEYLEALRGKPEILGDAFPKDVDKLIVLPKEPDSIYPYHLHEKYGVAIPCGLDIIDGEYRVSKQMRHRARDRKIGLVVCDRVIPEGFIHDMNSEDFQISAKMTK